MRHFIVIDHQGWDFQKWGVPQNGVCLGENPMNMDDLGVIPIYGKPPYIKRKLRQNCPKSRHPVTPTDSSDLTWWYFQPKVYTISSSQQTGFLKDPTSAAKNIGGPDRWGTRLDRPLRNQTQKSQMWFPEKDISDVTFVGQISGWVIG